MTPARKAALQWFHDRGEVKLLDTSGPSPAMVVRLVKDGLVQKERGPGYISMVRYRLTDAGRQALQEAGR